MPGHHSSVGPEGATFRRRQPLHGSTAVSATQPGPTQVPGGMPLQACPPCWPYPEPYTQLKSPHCHPSLNAPHSPSQGQPLGCRVRGPIGDLGENGHPIPRSCPCQVNEDPQVGNGRRVHQGQPSVLTLAGGRASAHISTLTVAPSDHMCNMLLLNHLPWLPPPTRQTPQADQSHRSLLLTAC